jgi:hypothetical protein
MDKTLDPESKIRDKHPGSATLHGGIDRSCLYFFVLTFKVSEEESLLDFTIKLCSVQLCHIKGSLTRDFRALVFFMNQCPPGP